jgi:hypothetical protein
MGDRISSQASLVQSVLRRPGMYTLGGTFEEVIAFLTGYVSGIARADPSAEAVLEWAEFEEWLASKLDSSPNEVFTKMRDLAPGGDPLRELSRYSEEFFGATASGSTTAGDSTPTR